MDIFSSFLYIACTSRQSQANAAVGPIAPSALALGLRRLDTRVGERGGGDGRYGCFGHKSEAIRRQSKAELPEPFDLSLKL